MRRFLVQLVAVLALLALATGALSGCGGASVATAQRLTPTPSPRTTHYLVTLHALNSSGVSGMAWLDLQGSELTVTIRASGLEPNGEHYQHIHGNADGTVACPTTADPATGITVEQGVAAVGPIALDLQPYAVVAGSGSEQWTHTYTLTPGDLFNLAPLTGHVLVLHGMTSHGVYDRAYFVACGQIQAV
jgi:hypothetical protein